MKLVDLIQAQKQEKALARQVGKHLAHMVWLYARNLWERGEARVKDFKSFDDFWAHYSASNEWKDDLMSESFGAFADDALLEHFTLEQRLAYLYECRST